MNFPSTHMKNKCERKRNNNNKKIIANVNFGWFSLGGVAGKEKRKNGRRRCLCPFFSHVQDQYAHAYAYAHTHRLSFYCFRKIIKHHACSFPLSTLIWMTAGLKSHTVCIVRNIDDDDDEKTVSTLCETTATTTK